MSLSKSLRIVFSSVFLLGMFSLATPRASAGTICPIGDCATLPPGITVQQQQALLAAADALLSNSFALGAQSVHCTGSLPVVPLGTVNPFPDCAHVCFWQAQLASAHALLAARMPRIALNEPGNVPPSPVFPSLTALTSAGCLTNAELQASNATLFNLSQALGVGQAVLGDYPPVPITPSELVTFQGNVIEGILPGPVAELLQSLGADSADTAIITNAWSVLITTGINADFPAVLNDAGTTASLQALSASVLTPFAAFTAHPGAETNEFEAPGSFTLAAVDTISPLTEDVSIQIGTTLATIPAGKFRNSLGNFTFEGVLNGAKVEASITPLASGFTFKFEAEGVGTAAAPAGLPVALVIGDSIGLK
jgi:hypothetical protein